MSPTAHAQKGFTLIEVLVALTLMALVSLISWRGLDAVQRTGERLDERAEEALALVRALGQLERDLLMHANADVMPATLQPLPDGGATPGASGAVHMPAGISWDEETGLSLVRSAGDGLWQQLRWYLQDGRLFRAEGAPSYQLPLPPIDTTVMVLEDVSALRLRMWQPGQGWIEPPRGRREQVVGEVPAKQDTDTDQSAGSAAAAVRARLAATTSPGLEVALHRRGMAADQLYRKVVILP